MFTNAKSFYRSKRIGGRGMAKFRMKKQELERLISPPSWPESAECIPEAVLAAAGTDSVSPLIALLPRGGLVMWRAAFIAGLVVTKIAGDHIEDARIIMRRLIWHLNKDSGKMGWGIPQAFGEILVSSCKKLYKNIYSAKARSMYGSTCTYD
jgi:hypothetical protein